jgi:hypothetical protein
MRNQKKKIPMPYVNFGSFKQVGLLNCRLGFGAAKAE